LELTKREAAGELETASVATIAERIRHWISAKRADIELELKKLQADVSDQPQVIQITGGLPELPGTNVILPHVNGHAATDLLTPATPVIPPAQTMTTKADGFIFTWALGKDGKWGLQDKTIDPIFATSGPSLNGAKDPEP
jgi:hypothetical protein